MSHSIQEHSIIDWTILRSKFVKKIVFRTCAAALISAFASPVFADGVPFHAGDIIVTGTSGSGYYWDSQIRHYSPDGVLLDTFDLGVSNTWPSNTGFDSKGNVYVPIQGGYPLAPNGNTVLKINTDGTREGTFGGTYGSSDNDIFEILFSSDGNAYISGDGTPNGLAPIFKVDGKGDLLATYSAQSDPTSGFGVEYAYLAPDQCTMRYTSQGESIKQFNVCTGTQMPNLVDSFPDPLAQPPYELLYSIRGLANGNMLVGTWDDFAYGLDKDGHVIQKYVASGDPYSSLNYVALDPDQKTFVGLDTWGGNGFRFNIQTGALLSVFNLYDPYVFAADDIAIVPSVDDSSDAGKNLGKQCHCAGDPINLATGNEFRDDSDLSLGALSFHRYYNSQSAVAPTHVGANWRDSFDRSIEYGGGNSTVATIFRPDGRQLKFSLVSGQWTSDPDVSDRLAQVTNDSGAFVGWDYFDATTRYHEGYDQDGKLVSITDTNGQITTLAYSTADTPASLAPAPGLLLAVTSPRGRTLNFAYDGGSRLASIREPDGGVLTYGHDTIGNLTSVTYPDKTSLQYVYNESALTGGTNLSSALTGSIDEDGNRFTSIGYNSQGQATMSMLASGIDRTQVAYNTNGTTSVSYPTGSQATLDFVAPYGSMHTSTVSSPCGPQCGQPNAAATFDANGHLASATDFNGNITKTSFGADGLLVQQIDASGSDSQRTTNLSWDTSMRVPLARTVVDAGGEVSSAQWIYNIRGQPLARCEIDPTNNAAKGYVCSVSGAVPAGVRRWTYSYCDAVDSTRCPQIGLLLSSTGPRTDVAQVTAYSYYLDSNAVDCGTPGAFCYQPGDLRSVTDALGHVTTIASYDADGRVTREVDPNGVHTDLAYTPRGWLASRNVGGAITQFSYTSYGAIASITDPDGVATRYTYDAAHRLTDITDAQGNRIHYTLDAAGNETAEQVLDSSGTVRRSLGRTFNTLGELTTVVDGLNRIVFSANAGDSYDANGNLLHSSDGLGVQQQRSYDALDRLVITIENYNGTDPATKNAQSVYAYDALDRLEGVSDPDGLITSYEYDGLGDAIAQHSPDTGTTDRTFDAAGDLLRNTDAKGLTVVYTYDALGRRTSASYPDNSQGVTYRYDETNAITGCARSAPIGRLTRIVEDAVTTTYCYDTKGRIIRKQQITSSGTDTVDYAYTAAGRLRALGYPDGSHVSYARDANGRIHSIEVVPVRGAAVTAVNDATYLPFGPLNNYRLGNGQTVTRTYDANYRLTDLASPAFSLHVARDTMGDIIAIGNSMGAIPGSETYNYDPLYRLTQITEADGRTLESVTYNHTGDRLSKSGSGLATGVYSYNPGTHQLIATGNEARAVDADGNTTAMSQAGANYGFGYDDRNRLSVVQLGRSTVAAYTYNALGERIAKDLSGRNHHARGGGSGGYGHGPHGGGHGVERFDYNESSQLLAEHGRSTRDYVWMDGIPVANVDTRGLSTVTYVTADQLGTPRAISNDNGETIWRWAYQGNVWGVQAPSSNGYAYNLRFPGQYFDAEDGLIYNGNRDYDAALGRYIQSDPLGLAGGMSTFAYVGNDSLSFVDPLGLRNVDVYIWHAKGLSVGHVMVTEDNSQQVILSQFPSSGWPYGHNVTKDFSDTMAAEGRPADSVWQINVPNDTAFDQSTAHERGLARWTWSPTDYSTQCSIAASRALQAGGVRLTAVTDGTLMPGFFDNNIRKNQDVLGNAIRHLRP